jgi:hypothetical protein
MDFLFLLTHQHLSSLTPTYSQILTIFIRIFAPISHHFSILLMFFDLLLCKHPGIMYWYLAYKIYVSICSVHAIHAGICNARRL